MMLDSNPDMLYIVATAIIGALVASTLLFKQKKKRGRKDLLQLILEKNGTCISS